MANDQCRSHRPPGEIHALLGENGAGKSTLMNILAGLYRPTQVRSMLHGSPPTSGRRAMPRPGHRHGAPALYVGRTQTVAENIILGLTGPAFACDMERIEQIRSLELSTRYGWRSIPSLHLAAIGGRAAARRDPQDPLPRRRYPDPGRAHGRADTRRSRRSWAHLRQMVQEGKSVIFITHKLMR
jgi:general nucleoside transport system ATP-binding protein